MKRKDTAERQRRKEELLRPSRYLGYDHDTIGVHLFSRGAYEIAEAEFRRAVWLNPFEPKFKIHLAQCLHARRNFEEARDWILKILKQDPDNKAAAELLKYIEEHSDDDKNNKRRPL